MKLINNDSSIFYTQLKLQAKKSGVTMKELCELSGVSQSSLSSWKHKNPSTIDALIKLQNTLNEIDGENSARQCTHCNKQ